MTNIKNTLIAKRYANALIELSKENNLNIEDINLQLNEIVESLKSSNELNIFMANPIISIEDKKDVIFGLLENKVDKNLINFIKLLIEKNRFDAIEDISDILDKTVKHIKNIQIVQVTSAIELRDEIKTRLVNKLSEKLNKQIGLCEEVNPDIIAGLIIKIDDNVIDMSLKHKFEEMNKEMIK